MSLLWSRDRITRCCSWVLALSSLFWLAAFMGSGLAALSKPLKIYEPPTIDSGELFNNSETKRWILRVPPSNTGGTSTTWRQG